MRSLCNVTTLLKIKVLQKVLHSNAIEQCFSNLSCKHPCSAHFVCLPCQTHPIQVLQSLLTSWWVESGVSDKGDIRNVQGRGACRTGLNRRTIFGNTKNHSVKGSLKQRSSTLLLGTHSPGKFISNWLQHTCLQFSSSLEEFDWPLQVGLIRVVAKLFRIVGPRNRVGDLCFKEPSLSQSEEPSFATNNLLWNRCKGSFWNHLDVVSDTFRKRLAKTKLQGSSFSGFIGWYDYST